MRMQNVAIAAALALGAAGCNEDTCPTESPAVTDLPQTCTQVAGEPVAYPVRLCPTCNQTGATCEPDLTAVNAGYGDIFLDTRVEACTASNSCAPGCDVNAITCTFTAPAFPGTYRVITLDGATGNTVERDLVVIEPGGVESCGLASASL